MPSGFTNGVLRTSVAPVDVVALIDDARAWFPPDLVWRWLVSELDRPVDLVERLIGARFQRRPVLPAMARELAGFDERATAHVQVTAVADAADLEAWLAVRNANHPLDDVTRDAWRATQSFVEGDALRQFLAWDGGRPVGSATLFLDAAADTAGLYHVDVVSDARGRGIGTAVTLVALDAAIAAGIRWAVLTATELGVPLYRRLGFDVVGEVTVFADTAR